MLTLPPSIAAVQGHVIRHVYMTAAVRLLASGSILELGSWAGCSMLTWAEACQRHGKAADITCIDQWRAYFGPEETAEHYKTMNANADEAYAAFKENADEACTRYIAIVRHERVGSLAYMARALTLDRKFDLVYVDADHTFPNVALDIAMAMQLVKEGGILCGDDLEIQCHGNAALQQFCHAHRSSDFVKNMHPGVTLAVEMMLGPVSCHEGFWLMRKRGTEWERVDELTCGFMPSHLDHEKVLA